MTLCRRHRNLLYLVIAGTLDLIVCCIVLCTGVPLESRCIRSLGQLFFRQRVSAFWGNLSLYKGSKKVSL